MLCSVQSVWCTACVVYCQCNAMNCVIYSQCNVLYCVVYCYSSVLCCVVYSQCSVLLLFSTNLPDISVFQDGLKYTLKR